MFMVALTQRGGVQREEAPRRRRAQGGVYTPWSPSVSLFSHCQFSLFVRLGPLVDTVLLGFVFVNVRHSQLGA